MGLFSFLKKSGDKRFEEEKKAATPDPAAVKAARETALRKALTDYGISIQNLDLRVDDDKVTVYGTADSQATREKAVLVLGNIQGVATVDDRITVNNPEPEAQFYEVKSGDSLSKIAKQFYGDPMKYPMIFDANKPMLKDPDKIYPGQVLRIPSVK